MKFNGLKLDNPTGTVEVGTWAYAKNILLGKGFDNLLTEDYPTSILDLSNVERISYALSTPTEIILFVYQTDIKRSKLIRISNDTTVTIAINYNIYLDFAETVTISGVTSYRTIQGIYLYNNKGELIIVFTDNIVSPMIFNLGTISSPTTFTISSSTDLDTHYLFPYFNQTNIELKDVISRGYLKSGVYYASLAYEIEEGITTSYGIISNPIMVVKDVNTTSYDQFQGNKNNDPAFKSIVLNISNPDIRYKKFYIAIIKDGIAYRTEPINILSTSIDIIISDLDILTTLAIDEVLIKNTTYEKVKTLAFCNQRLRLANVSSVKRRSLSDIYEKLIKYIKIEWVYEDIININQVDGSYKDPTIIFSKRGFKRDEVYALYLSLHLKTGEEYGVYHIPGRASNFTIGDPFYEIVDSIINTGNGNETFKYYQIHDTCGTPFVSANEMSYWENKNEIYPSTFGTTLSGKKIRHHKFPSASFLETYYNEKYKTQTEIIGDSFVCSLGLFPQYPKDGIYSTTYTIWYFARVIPYDVFTLGDFTIPRNYGVATMITTSDTADPTSSSYYTAVQTKYTSNQDHRVTFHYSDIIFQNLQYEELSVTHPSFKIEVKTYDINGINDGSRSFTIDYNTTGSEGYTLNRTDSIELLKDEYVNFLFTIGGTQLPNGTPVPAPLITGDLIISQFPITKKGVKILGIKPTIDWTSIQTNDSTFYSEILNYCDSYEIKYAERTLEDSLILDQGIVTTSKKDLIDPIFPGLTNSYFRYYSVDSLINNLNINPTYLKFANRRPLNIPILDATKKINQIIVDDYENNSTFRLDKIKEIKYLPAYNSATIPNNDHKDNCYEIEVYDTHLIPTHIQILTGTPSIDFSLINLVTIKDDCYVDFSNKKLVSTGKVISINTNISKIYGGDIFINYCNVISSLNYSPPGNGKGIQLFTNIKFLSESISNIGFRYKGENEWEKYYPISNNIDDIRVAFTAGTYPTIGGSGFGGTIKSGDIFIKAVLAGDSMSYTSLTYLKALTDNPGTTSSNWSDNRIGKLEETGQCNIILYDNIFNKINDLIISDIQNPNSNNQYEFKYRIHSSIIQSSEVSSVYFRKFLHLDKYDMPNQKGGIVKLSANNRILFVQHENTLFRAFIIDKLSTENISAFLKSGDIFDRMPEELFFDNNSYISCQGVKSAIMTPYGYVIVDTITKAVYVISESIENITKNGIEKWFRDKLNTMTFNSSDISSILKNPTLGYDKQNERLLLTINDSASGTPFTLSYQFEFKKWIAFHDNSPSYYIWNSMGIYAIRNYSATALTSLFSNTSILKLNQVPQPYQLSSIIDMIFSNLEGDKFLLESINWTAECFSPDKIKRWNETFTYATIYNNNQCSDSNSLTIQKIQDSIYGLTQVGNVVFDDTTYRYNEFKDYVIDPKSKFIKDDFTIDSTKLNISKNWYEFYPFIGKFIIVRLEFKNLATDRRLIIHNIGIKAKPVL